MNAELPCAVLMVVLGVVVTEESSAPGQIQRGGCVFHRHTTEHGVMDRLDRLLGQRLSAKDDDPTGYSYNIGICTPAEDLANVGEESADNIPYKYAAVTQRRKGAEQPTNQPGLLGRLDKVDIIGGTNWISLEYDGGDKYHSHCASEPKRSVVMFLCAPGEKEGKVRVLEENTNKTASCYYLFEIDHEAACADAPPAGGLSVGSILIIIFLCVIALYLLGGFIYQRFVVGAKGMEQLPNFAFWQDFGNLQADGCNLICRSGSQTEPKQYRGLGDDQLQSAPEEEDERDDHLLPM